MTGDLQRSADVTVIGAGIVGVCTALSLREKGAAVRLVDRNAPGTGASFGNAGVVSPWSCVPQSLPGTWKNVPKWLLDPDGPLTVKPSHLLRFLPWALRFLRAGKVQNVWQTSAAMNALVHPNIEIYRRHLAGTGHEGLLQDSWYVQVFRSVDPPSLKSIGWQLRQQINAPVELVDGDQLREIEPDLASDFTGAVLIKDQARVLAPGRLCEVLAEKFAQMGGEIVRAEIQGISPDPDGGWQIKTAKKTELSGTVVLAAGAWSHRLLSPLGIEVPLEAERGYHVLFKDPGVTLRHSVMDMEAMFVASSMEMGLRSAGTAEFAGLDAALNKRRAEALARHTRRMLPKLGDETPEIWMGPRPSMPDSLPCIGGVPGHPGLIAAFGHSHYGLGMAPKTGQLVAELATGQQPNTDLTPYRIDRFFR